MFFLQYQGKSLAAAPASVAPGGGGVRGGHPSLDVFSVASQLTSNNCKRFCSVLLLSESRLKASLVPAFELSELIISLPPRYCQPNVNVYFEL